MFDEIALKLNDKWNEVVSDAALGATSLKLLSPQQQRQAKTLKIIGFRPLLASVENGVVIPAVRQVLSRNISARLHWSLARN